MAFARTLALAALLAAAGSAQAGLVASDSLNTATAGSLAGQAGGSGWAGAWTGSNSVSVVDTGVADGSISGQALRFSGADNTSAATRALEGSISGAKVFVDFSLQFSAGSIDQNDFLGLWFGSYTGPNIGIKGNCDGAGNCNGADLFVRTTGSGGSFTTAMTVGTTYHLFALLEKTNGSSVYNRYSLWVDPTDAERSSLTGADAVFTGSSGLSSFSTIGFRTANLDAGDAVLVDALTVGELPEPATLALAGAGLLGLAAARRRKAA
ncbi:MAG: PEP-CTERM sorting domain-containing protein [Roseateles depolymerans]|uniref:PEP-CTERM sorting domain-containing protein n=1 Tax=Roseateles depolymerans TaxID=76731 RepID=A0A2W5FKC4_9BURK|nr:MAG: PEP-CTERM sorting domain-containing protein [Roseateles depolymerans]